MTLQARYAATLSGALVAVVLTAAVGVSQATVGASTSSPPATAAQVRALVAASAKITKLNSTVLSELAKASNDQPWTQYGSHGSHGCDASTVCAYGDTASKVTMVLFGDSHAAMWLSAVAPWAKQHHERLILVWSGGCPPAKLATNWQWLGTGVSSNPGCLTWRSAAISYIVSLHAKMILVAERTAAIVSEPSGVRFTSAQWLTGLVTTMRQLGATKTKVAVIEDIPWHTYHVPECLSVKPNDVQACSVSYPNRDFPGQQVSEAQAARRISAGFISTTGWFCTQSNKTCSSVIGNYITYWDSGHVTASFSAYLTGVMGTALTRVST